MADEKENPHVFTVRVKDKLTEQEMTLSVSKNEHIKSQEDAEKHVLSQGTSIGGKHPGFELVKDAPAPEAAK